MKEIILYGHDRCPHCVNAKDWLGKNSIPFMMKDTNIKENYEEYVQYKEQGVPLLIVKDLENQTESKILGFSPDAYATKLGK
ncbi:glutaredoxin family protein [Bacillus cereus]|uniref:glutaredoxin family protein n=1 Tax=Bacillus cereus TaxID=1396 RepID=UPI00124EF13D|nr:glutaredoxin family protein [Bacillus cereus]KAB2477755.1 glutaredoxin family protein [Bacillus cereus]